MKINRFILSVIAILILSASVFAESFIGECVGVTDGDTISVMHNGKAEKIRLNGIDCPESHQDFGAKAKKFASYLVFGENVRVEVVDTDKYGRTVGNVYAPDGQSLNKALIEQGLAWWYKEYAKDDRDLEQLEVKAREAKKGLWSQPNPVAPWEFRHGKAQTETPSAVEEQQDVTSSMLKEQKRLLPSDLPDEEQQDVISSMLIGEQKKSNNEVAVYVTRTGSKYHCAGCKYLAKSMIPVSLKEAKTKYSPCSVCKPPE